MGGGTVGGDGVIILLGRGSVSLEIRGKKRWGLGGGKTFEYFRQRMIKRNMPGNNYIL